ncbi:MAG: PD-(D/E)XK nuclease family transposase [Parabacteroides sp.]
MFKKERCIWQERNKFIFLQLPLFGKQAEECENDFDRWIYVLKHMETFKRLPWAAQNSVFQRLAEIADISSLSREERLKYDVALRKYRDTIGVLEGAKLRGEAKGRAEGLAKGRAEGMAKGRLEIARNLKADGMSFELIQKYTGLSLEEILKL